MFSCIINYGKVISYSLDFSFNDQNLVSLFSPLSMSVLVLIVPIIQGPVLNILVEKAVYATISVLLSIVKNFIVWTDCSAERLCHVPPLSVTGWIFLPETQAWHVFCAWSVMSGTHSPTDNFPPINCALFLSFNLRHAINCDLLHLGTCLCLRWRKHAEALEKHRQTKWDGSRQQNTQKHFIFQSLMYKEL